MTPFILKNNPTPKKQSGELVPPKCNVGGPVCFKRRKPEQSDIFNDLNDFYDFIRMLDADGYPKAFLKIGNHRILFNGVSKKQGKLEGKFEIVKKSKE